MTFQHRNFQPGVDAPSSGWQLVCEECGKPLWKHHALNCPPADRRQEQGENKLRRQGDWPVLADVPQGNPIDQVLDVVFIDMVQLNGRVLVLTSKGLFQFMDGTEPKLVPLSQ